MENNEKFSLYDYFHPFFCAFFTSLKELSLVGICSFLLLHHLLLLIHRNPQQPHGTDLTDLYTLATLKQKIKTTFNFSDFSFPFHSSASSCFRFRIVSIIRWKHKTRLIWSSFLVSFSRFHLFKYFSLLVRVEVACIIQRWIKWKKVGTWKWRMTFEI